MKKKLFVLLLALFIFMPFINVNAESNGNFGVDNKCKWSFDNGAFVIEPVDTTCELEYGSQSAWNTLANDIKSFTIKPGVKAPSQFTQYFWELGYVEEIDVNDLDVSNATSMQQIFSGVGSNATKPIAELNLSKWNTKNVTTMAEMFSSSNIKELTLGKDFDTSKVTNMKYMFQYSKFEKLTLNFDTENVTTMYGMFSGAKDLKKLDLSSFEVGSGVTIEYMFYGIGNSVKEGTEIVLNKSFERTDNDIFSRYNLPNGFYTVNGGEAKATNTTLNVEIGRASGRATLIPVMPLHISLNDGDGSNVGEDIVHRMGTQIDMSGVVAIKNGHKLVKWTDTDDGQNAKIEIPAYGKSEETWADYYNSTSGSQLATRQSLYAQWEPLSASDKCKVLVLNVDDSSLLTSIEVTCGETIAESDIKIPGYKLGDVFDINDDPFDFSTKIENDTIIYAQISANKYTTYAETATGDNTQGYVGVDPEYIIYFMVGPGTGELPSGSLATYYAKPADGYRFVRWDIKNDDSSSTVIGTSTDNPVTFKIVDSDLYYYAVFAPDTAPVHKVTFELDGGTINGASTYSVDVEDGQTVTRPDDPKKTGHRFRRWCEDAALTIEFDFSKKIDGPTTVYADFVEQVTTTLDANGGKKDSNWKDSGNTDKGSTIYQVGDFFSSHLSLFGVSAPDDKEYDGVEITDAKGTYVFKEGDGKSYTTNLDHIIKFLWKDTSVNPITEYTIEVENGAPNKTEAEYGETIRIEADVVPSGKEFDRWSVVEGGPITFANPNSPITTFTMPASNVKIIVIYKDRYTIVEGANQTYTIGSNTDVVIKASGDVSDLDCIKVDGSILDLKNYKIESGSTILKLFSSYLDGLSEGNHTVEFTYTDGSTKTMLNVAKEPSSTVWNVKYDLNGAKEKPGFMVKPFTIYDGYTDKIPTWAEVDDILEAPKGKVYIGVEINGKKYDIGSTYVVKSDTNIKILWENTNNNTGPTINNNTSSPQTGDNIITNIITLLLSLLGVIGGITYMNRKKLFNR